MLLRPKEGRNSMLLITLTHLHDLRSAIRDTIAALVVLPSARIKMSVVRSRADRRHHAGS